MYIVQDGKAHQVPVELGSRVENRVEVVKVWPVTKRSSRGKISSVKGWRYRCKRSMPSGVRGKA